MACSDTLDSILQITLPGLGLRGSARDARLARQQPCLVEQAGRTLLQLQCTWEERKLAGAGTLSYYTPCQQNTSPRISSDPWGMLVHLHLHLPAGLVFPFLDLAHPCPAYESCLDQVSSTLLASGTIIVMVARTGGRPVRTACAVLI